VTSNARAARRVLRGCFRVCANGLRDIDQAASACACVTICHEGEQRTGRNTQAMRAGKRSAKKIGSSASRADSTGAAAPARAARTAARRFRGPRHRARQKRSARHVAKHAAKHAKEKPASAPANLARETRIMDASVAAATARPPRGERRAQAGLIGISPVVRNRIIRRS